MDTRARRLTELSPEDSLRLLGTVPLGRVLYTQQALPAALPACHLIENGELLIRCDEELIGPSADGAVLGYQADSIDPDTHVGWTVLVTGMAKPIVEPILLDHYRALLPSLTESSADQIVSIAVHLVRGHQLVPD